MRVEVEDGIVVCGTNSDWKQLPENEHEFLHKCFTFWEGFTKNGKLKWYELQTKRADVHEERFRRMLKYAETCGVEVAVEVQEAYKTLKAQADAAKLLEERLMFLESKRKAWAARERTGCEGCRDCERIGDGWFKCKYSGDDLDARFSEIWDPVTRCMIIFHEVGVPNAHCKDYYQERKEFGR